MNDHIFIEKKKKDNADPADYENLQKSALELVQQMSGNLWTDFNAHDPGVTIMDVVNYALSELNFKLGFDLEDYLIDTDGSYNPNKYGLYFPDQVYPTNPVTPNDFRKLLFDRVEGIIDVHIVPAFSGKFGYVDLIVSTAVDVDETQKNRIENDIHKVYHMHRNLGEMLEKVHFKQYIKLNISGDILLNENGVVDKIFAEIYFQCVCYFNPGIKYTPIDPLSEDIAWEQIFDGPLLQGGYIDNESLKPPRSEFTLADLFYIINKIDGISDVVNIALSSSEGHEFTSKISNQDLLCSYQIEMPKYKKDVGITLLRNNKEVYFDYTNVKKEYKRLINQEYGRQNKLFSQDYFSSFIFDKRNGFAEYESIQNDFPSFYGINKFGVPSHFSEERKAQAMQLKGYLLLYDFVLANSMKEIDELKDLLKVNGHMSKYTIPNLDKTVAHFAQLVDSKDTEGISFSDSFKIEVKNTLFDLLDTLYGESSISSFLQDFDVYGIFSNPVDSILHRANFIKKEHDFNMMRMKAMNLFDSSPDNVSGVKLWFEAMLGLPNAKEVPVTNVFSEFSLRLLSDDEFYNDMKGMLNIDFVLNDLDTNFQDESIFEIPTIKSQNPFDDYSTFRSRIYLFHHNIIFESFLREGVFLKNYKMIQTRDKEYLLAYHAKDKEEWIGLGRFRSREETAQMANMLQVFLIQLNRQCENMYVVENFLLTDDYCLTIILPDWTTLFHNNKFREWCEEQLEERTPAHMKINVRWINAPLMRLFEKYYFGWKLALRERNQIEERRSALLQFLTIENLL